MTADNAPLRERVVLVTGAAGAIGRGLARHFRECGARVALVDLVDPHPADRGVADGGTVLRTTADVSRFEECERVVSDCLARWGRVDVLVNNAAVVDNVVRTDRMEPSAWDREIAVNLSGAFYLTKLVLPGMLEQRWGRIINISSVASGGFIKQAGYSASKAGLLGLTGSVASEFAEVGITCNAVLPGLIDTPRVRSAPEDILEAAIEGIPSRRLGDVEEVVAAVGYLAEPNASYITGASIRVDGGAHLPAMRFARRSRFD